MIIAIVILGIIAIVLIAAASMSEDYNIEQHITINRSKTDVFNYLRILQNAEKYNKWVMEDPNLKKQYIGIDGTVGFIYKWNSDMKSVGQGEQEMIGITEGQRIDYEIRFIKPFEGVSGASLTTVAAGDNATDVTWAFNGKRTFGMKIFHLLFNLKKVLAKDLQTSLQNLKNVLEK
jgi:hypothetical protein